MRFPLRLSHLRHMDMPYGTLPDPVQVVFSGIAPGQVIAATAFLPDTMTVGSAAWRARPSGPDRGLIRSCGIYSLLRCKPPSPVQVIWTKTIVIQGLARVEGSVPPTSGFGDRRSPLSYTRILFERVRICTSHGIFSASCAHTLRGSHA